MERYVTNIKDFVIQVLENGSEIKAKAESGDALYCFQMGMIFLLGIDTPIDYKKAKYYFESNSLKNDSDSKCLLGFIAEINGDYSTAFKYYSDIGGFSNKNRNNTYLRCVVKGRDYLQAFLKNMSLPLTINELLSKMFADSINANASSKMNAKVKLAFLCKNELVFEEAAKDLLKEGESYKAMLLLQKCNNKESKSKSIPFPFLNSKNDEYITKDSVIDVKGGALLTGSDSTLSISGVLKECNENSKKCEKKWQSSNKVNVEKIIKSQKRKEQREEKKKAEKKRNNIVDALILIALAIVFIVLWIWSGSIKGALLLFGLFILVFISIFALIFMFK